MKTVVHILNTGSFSGAEHVAITIIKELNQLYSGEYRSIYVALQGNIRERLEKEQIEYFLLDKLSIKNIKTVIKKYHPDLLHTHDFTASMLSSMASSKIPIICHLHNNNLWIRTWNLKTMVYALTLGKYKKVIAVSDAIVNEFVYSDRMIKKTIVLGNPINIKAIHAKAGDLNTKRYDIAFLGRLSTEKDPLRFIKIIRDLVSERSGLKAVIIGTGEMQKICEEQVKKLQLTENIHFAGFLDNPYPILKEAKILCITSQWEGFGLMAVEGLTTGLPIVSTYVGGLKNIINDSCGLFCNSDTEFHNEINHLLNDEIYYSLKMQGALQRANELDNISEYIAKLNKIYGE